MLIYIFASSSVGPSLKKPSENVKWHASLTILGLVFKYLYISYIQTTMQNQVKLYLTGANYLKVKHLIYRKGHVT